MRVRRTGGNSRPSLPRLVFVLCFAVAPTLSADGLLVTSGVTFEPGLPKNGGIATAFLTGLTLQGILPAQGTPLPLSIEGITVDVCGNTAPLYAVADMGGYQQINFQVPWESQFSFDGTNERCLITVRQGSFQAIQNAYVRRDVAADLFFTPDYIGILQHGTDYSRVTRQRPAIPGEALVIYAAALPQTDPAVPTGTAAPLSPLAVVNQYASTAAVRVVSIQIDSSSAMVPPFFVGLVPGQVGLYQLNFWVPETLNAGDHVLRVVIGTCGAIHGAGCLGLPSSYAFSNPVILPVTEAEQP